ncbi:MAG TPA: hypothetical protein VK972_02250, partial [Wenzhouxiangella sp.]|nr:hypothetical protein [Wenzhouxiangella sp.]
FVKGAQEIIRSMDRNLASIGMGSRWFGTACGLRVTKRAPAREVGHGISWLAEEVSPTAVKHGSGAAVDIMAICT